MTARAPIAMLAAGVCIASSAHADGNDDQRNPRRRTGTHVAYAGVATTLTGVALGAFAIGLGNDRPDAARPFYDASGIALGAGVITLGTGLYIRESSPADPPDPISLDPIRARHRNERRVGIALAGLGAASMATGIAHAVGAVRDSDLAAAQCPAGICNADGARLRSREHELTLAADILTGIGAVGVAGGIVLYRGGRDTGAQLAPVVTDRSVGLAAVGTF